MITRLARRKRPRRSALMAIWGSALAAFGLFAMVALATVSDAPDAAGCDIQIGNKNQTDICSTTAGAKIRYIGDSNQTFGASGTGTFNPFVRLQANPNERGYNTDGAVEFDTKTGTWTHAIKVSEIPVRTEDGCSNCWELFVDINDGNSNKPISLNDMEIWFTTNPNLVGYGATGFSAGATKEYDFAGNILISDVNQGSGRGDLRYMVPRTEITIPANCQYGNPSCETYFVLYSRWGVTPAGFPSDGGFEEWKVRIYPTPPDISVAKTPDAGSINAGDNAVFTIVVTNNGPIAAENVTLTDVLPDSGLSWTVGGADAAACAGTNPHDGGTTLTCNFGTVAFPGSKTITLTSPTDSGDCRTINNTGQVSATNEDAAQLGNNSDSGAITVSCPDVSVVKTPDGESTAPGTIANGANAVFTITVTNGGPGVASSVTVSDSLPTTNGLDWSITSQGLNPGYSGGSACSLSAADALSCTISNLAASGSYRVVLTSATTAANCGTINNTVTISATGDINATNDSDTGSIAVQCAAIQILKQSTKTGNPLVTQAGAVFSVTGPGSYSSSVTDNGTGDEDATVGEVCISGLVPGTYTVNETTPPDGYGAATSTNQSATAASGTDCSNSPPSTANSAVFVNAPLADLLVRVEGQDSGEIGSWISCVNSADESIGSVGDSSNPVDPAELDVDDLEPDTYTCTIVIDP